MFFKYSITLEKISISEVHFAYTYQFYPKQIPKGVHVSAVLIQTSVGGQPVVGGGGQPIVQSSVGKHFCVKIHSSDALVPPFIEDVPKLEIDFLFKFKLLICFFFIIFNDFKINMFQRYLSKSLKKLPVLDIQ